MRWHDLSQSEPRFAALARERLVDPGVLLVVTIRRDGSPRLSPVEPLVLDGDLWLSLMWQSRKAADLRRDDRVLVHSIVTTRDGTEGELKLRGRARPVDDLDVRARYCDAVAALGWRPEEPWFHLFRIDIEDVMPRAETSTSPDGRAGPSSSGARPRPRASGPPSRSPTCSVTTRSGPHGA